MSIGNNGPRTKTLGVIIHCTRSGVDRDVELEAYKTLEYAQGGGDNYNRIITPTRTISVVDKPLGAWHARKPVNDTHLAYGIAQTRVDRPIDLRVYKRLAKEIVDDARTYGFPPLRVLSQKVPGIAGHEDIENGKQDKKTDPGPLFLWDQLMKEIVALTVKPFNIATERDILWGIKDNLASHGHVRLAQAVEAAVTLSKGEK